MRAWGRPQTRAKLGHSFPIVDRIYWVEAGDGAAACAVVPVAGTLQHPGPCGSLPGCRGATQGLYTKTEDLQTRCRDTGSARLATQSLHKGVKSPCGKNLLTAGGRLSV